MWENKGGNNTFQFSHQDTLEELMGLKDGDEILIDIDGHTVKTEIIFIYNKKIEDNVFLANIDCSLLLNFKIELKNVRHI